MGKGKRVKAERKKRAAREKSQNISLLHPSLPNYPEGVPDYLRRVSAKSGKALASPQKWRTLPKEPIDLRLSEMARDGIAATVNDKFQVLISPFCVEELSFEKESYNDCKLVKGSEKAFAANETVTFRIGTAEYYRNIKSKTRSQRDPNEGSISLGPCDIDIPNIEGTKHGSLNANVSINYDKGYIYSCSILEGKKIEAPEYETYTVFNASPQRIALALGTDVGSHLMKKAVKISGLPKIRVFYGMIQYIDNESRTEQYISAEISNQRSDLATIFTKTPDYSHQKEFRFFITVDGLLWDFESNRSLTVAMSPNFQCHFGYTYWAGEYERH